MSTNRVFEGKDLAEALAEASARLGIPEPNLDYEIVEQGRRGLFGLGARSVQIRVMPPIDQDTQAAGHGELAGVPGAGPGRHRGGRRRGRRPAGEAPEGNQRRSRKRRPRDRSENDDAPRPVQTEEREPEPPASEETVAQVKVTVEKMLQMLGLDLTVNAAGAPGGTEIELAGPDEELLAAGDAEAISAWQFLLNRMSRRTWPEAGRIHVYCNGHRQGRDEDLLELARETAEQVLQDGRAKRLRPMNSYERRLIHLTVRQMRGVDSRSEGDGPLKRVRVFKRRRRQRRRGPRNNEAS